MFALYIFQAAFKFLKKIQITATLIDLKLFLQGKMFLNITNIVLT